MAHAQKPDFVFRRNGWVHLNRQERQFSRLLAAEVCVSAVVMLDTPCSEVVWRVLATDSIRQFPLLFPSRTSSHFNCTLISSHSPPPTPTICPGLFANFYVHVFHDSPTTQSSAQSPTVNSKFFQTSFPYPRNSNGPKTLPCSTADITLTSSDNCPPTLTLFERPKSSSLTYTSTNCQLTISLYRRKWLCGFGRSISLIESSRREATEYLPCCIMRECDGRCDGGTPLPCQMTCKCRCTLWMLTLLASVRLIECHKQLSSVHSVTVTAADVCFIGTVLNVLERELGTYSVCVFGQIVVFQAHS